MSKGSRLALLAAALMLVVGAGCKKEHESLVVAELSAVDQTGSVTLNSVKLAVTRLGQPVTSKIFYTPAGVSSDFGAPTGLGIYIPGDVTGEVTITATAYPQTGCDGFTGINTAGTAVIEAAGDTVTVSIRLRPAVVCGSTGSGGTTGSGGKTGTAGTGGGGTTGSAGSGPSCGTTVGAVPTSVAPPTLASCTEYDHSGPGLTCDTTNHVNDPWIGSLAVSPDGQFLVTAGSSAYDGTFDAVKVWKLQNGVPTPCGPIISNPDKGPPLVAFSPNGRYLAVAWRQAFVDIYNVPSFTLVGTAESSTGPLYGVGFTPDSQQVVSLDWDNGTDGHLYVDRVDGTAVTSSSLGIEPDALAVSPVAGASGLPVAVAGFDGTVGVYLLGSSGFSAPTLLPSATTDPSWSVQFSPDGKLLVDGNDVGVVHFWSVPTVSTTPTGTAISLSSSTAVYGLAFHPGGSYLGVAFDKEFDIYNVGTRTMVSRHAVSTFMDSISFSASGGALIGGEDNCGKFTVCGN